MGYASKEALLEYTQKSKSASGSGLFRVIGIAGIIIGIASMGTEAGMVFTMVCIAAGIFLFYMGGQTGRETKEYLKYLKIAESTGEMQRILNDFANSQSLADDRIRLGSEYIFSRKQGRPITYAELRKVYPYVVSGTNCARYLKGVSASGADAVRQNRDMIILFPLSMRLAMHCWSLKTSVRLQKLMAWAFVIWVLRCIIRIRL